ncbi:MAG: S-layer homology domain-containing protein, partial [Clostridiales bacterium]|nr:S-layer homology domain-containing protein [Clostridiales bacterium]
KVYIVGEDSNGIDSDVLDITIPAYNAPPLLTGGAATRSSNSNATVTFTSDKDGTCYYVVLHEDEAAPSASAIKGDGTAGMDMLEGKNTISLSTLAAGSWKIYIVGEDSNGIDSDVLGITIPAYNASSPPYGGGSSGGTTIAKPEVPLADPISFPPFIQGFEDKTFRGDGFMTREQFVAILFRLNAEQPATPYAGDPSFGDVPPGRWSFNAVEWAKGEGIIEADEDGNFHPAAPLSRADMATMFVKAEKLTDMAENAFSDIDGHPSADDILKAVKAGIFTGYKDGTFKPDGSTTRNEAVTALIRYLLGKEPAESMWQDTTLALTDTSSTDWAYKYVVLAVDGYTGVPR